MRKSNIYLSLTTLILGIAAWAANKTNKGTTIFYCTAGRAMSASAVSCCTKASAPVGAATCHTGTKTLYTCTWQVKKVVFCPENT